MDNLYYVEISISGCIAINAASREKAEEMVRDAISGAKEDAEIMESIGNMARQHIDCGNVDVGEVIEEEG